LASGDQKYLAGVIVAKRGTPVLLNVTNQLPNKALIPVDPTIMAGPNGLMVGDLPRTVSQHTCMVASPRGLVMALPSSGLLRPG
jgi:hypothetical protein